MSEFNGFSKELTTFFKNLKKNNSKEWFDKHRQDYDTYIIEPAREFVVAMGEKLRNIAPSVNAIPKVNASLFRINRDTRFSKDKSPYKTNMGLWFWDGSGKRMECSGFYFHLEEKKLMLGVGVYMFPKTLIQTYRDAVVDKKYGRQLTKAVKELTIKGYKVDGKHYKRVPHGYDDAHPNTEFLLYNGLHAMIEDDIPVAFYTPDIVDYAYKHYKNMVPIHNWLKTVVNQ
jgi:uncharacterized protein (TIGR02453 family)